MCRVKPAGFTDSISPVCFCSICTKTEQVSFDRTTGTIRFPLNKMLLRRWRKKGKEMEEEWKGGREGCLAFRGILISFLGCYTSRHCLRFAISLLTCHAVWAHSSPAEQNYLAKQWSENWENGAVMVLAGWKRTLYLHVVCWYIRSSSLWLSFKLLSHDMCLNSFNNRHSDQPEYMGGMLKATCPVLHVFRSLCVTCKLTCERVCASYLPSCCCADQCCHLFHWPACDGAPLNLWRNSMWDLGSKNESDGRKKNKQTNI